MSAIKFVERSARYSIKNIDRSAKNKFKWSWLEDTVNLEFIYPITSGKQSVMTSRFARFALTRFATALQVRQ